ncbi:hypothetical protein L195_g028274, partial [Trifolium pratense]
VLLYDYYSQAGRETDIEKVVVREDLGGGGENSVGGAPVIELVEVGGRLVEVERGEVSEVPITKQPESEVPAIEAPTTEEPTQTTEETPVTPLPRAGREIDVDRVVVQDDLGGSGENLGGIPVIKLVEVLLYNYYSRVEMEIGLEKVVVQKDLGEGGKNLVDSIPVIKLVEVGGHLIEVAQGVGVSILKRSSAGLVLHMVLNVRMRH